MSFSPLKSALDNYFELYKEHIDFKFLSELQESLKKHPTVKYYRKETTTNTVGAIMLLGYKVEYKVQENHVAWLYSVSMFPLK